MEEKMEMKNEDIRALCIEAHENAVKHGFWAEKHDIKHYLMLVITELAEAVQAYRKGKFCRREDYEDNIKQGISENTAFMLTVKDTFEDEMADACIRLMDLAGFYIDYCKFEDKKRFAPGEIEHRDMSEVMFNAVAFIVNYCSFEPDIATFYMIRLCEAMNIDIEWHIRAKMAYNKSRPYLHGNKF